MPKISTPPNAYLPDGASPPGGTLKDVLEERGMSRTELAEHTGLPRKSINLIIKGEAPLTEEIALLFEKSLGIPANFWDMREKNYRDFMNGQMPGCFAPKENPSGRETGGVSAGKPLEIGPPPLRREVEEGSRNLS